jgi:hypothetical protein
MILRGNSPGNVRPPTTSTTIVRRCCTAVPTSESRAAVTTRVDIGLLAFATRRRRLVGYHETKSSGSSFVGNILGFARKGRYLSVPAEPEAAGTFASKRIGTTAVCVFERRLRWRTDRGGLSNTTRFVPPTVAFSSETPCLQCVQWKSDSRAAKTVRNKTPNQAKRDLASDFFLLDIEFEDAADEKVNVTIALIPSSVLDTYWMVH